MDAKATAPAYSADVEANGRNLFASVKPVLGRVQGAEPKTASRAVILSFLIAITAFAVATGRAAPLNAQHQNSALPLGPNASKIDAALHSLIDASTQVSSLDAETAQFAQAHLAQEADRVLVDLSGPDPLAIVLIATTDPELGRPAIERGGGRILADIEHIFEVEIALSLVRALAESPVIDFHSSGAATSADK